MNNVRNTVILDIQTINHLANLILSYTEEEPTEKLVGQIKSLTNRIIKITEVFE